MAVMWSVAGLLCLSPIFIAAALTGGEWYLNWAFWFFVGPGVIGAMCFGPAWYWRRHQLLKREFRASEPAAERQ